MLLISDVQTWNFSAAPHLPLVDHIVVCMHVCRVCMSVWMCVCMYLCMYVLTTDTQQGIFSGQQQQQQQQQHQMNNVSQMANALVMPLVFGDSRDLTIKKFNQLQAYCGHGKGIVNHAQSIDFSHDNPYCRFKVFCINNITIFVNTQIYL